MYSLLGIVRVNSFSLNIFDSRALFSRLSLFNFQGPFSPSSRGQLCYYITLFSLCQVLFWNFSKKFLTPFSQCSALADSLYILSHTFSIVKLFLQKNFVLSFLLICPFFMSEIVQVAQWIYSFSVNQAFQNRFLRYRCIVFWHFTVLFGCRFPRIISMSKLHAWKRTIIYLPIKNESELINPLS